MPDVKWIKLSTEIFESRKIRQIESMPEGDGMIVIWLKLLCLAGKVNDRGYVYFTGELPYTEQMLATEFNRPLATVKLAMQTFIRFGMIGTEGDVFFITNWDKYQNTDRLSQMREYNRLAQQRSRAKKKALDAVNDMSMTVRPCQGAEEEKDKDSEKEKENPYCLSGGDDFEKEDSKQAYMGGTLGQGVVFISPEQMDDLLEKLSVEEFDHYISVIAECEKKGKHFSKSHYQAVLDMAAKDRKIRK